MSEQGLRARDWIYIRELQVECIIGIFPHERKAAQPLSLDIGLGLDLSRAGRSARITDTLDYDQVTEQVRALVHFRRYRLLENAAEELCAMLFGVHPELREVRLRLQKPLALKGRARHAEVSIERSRADYTWTQETTQFGHVDILFESREAGLYLLNIAPGSGIPRHYHRRMRELEFWVRGQVERDGVQLVSLAPQVWPKGQVHEYRNIGSELATLFCCDMPPFIPQDEIEAPDEELGSRIEIIPAEKIGGDRASTARRGL